VFISESQQRREESDKQNSTFSPSPDKKNFVNKRKYMKRGTSNDSVKFGTKNILITSDITISSVDQREEILDLDEHNNSIISEEDSAFEDQTPAAGKNKMKNHLPDFGQRKLSDER